VTHWFVCFRAPCINYVTHLLVYLEIRTGPKVQCFLTAVCDEKFVWKSWVFMTEAKCACKWQHNVFNIPVFTPLPVLGSFLIHKRKLQILCKLYIALQFNKHLAANDTQRYYRLILLIHFMPKKIYPYFKLEVSSFTRSKDRAPVPCNWLDAQVVCSGVQTNARISVVFYPPSTKSGVNVVEWSTPNAHVLDFWCLRIIELRC